MASSAKNAPTEIIAKIGIAPATLQRLRQRCCEVGPMEALERKKLMPPLADEEIPELLAYGRDIVEREGVGEQAQHPGVIIGGPFSRSAGTLFGLRQRQGGAPPGLETSAQNVKAASIITPEENLEDVSLDAFEWEPSN